MKAIVIFDSNYGNTKQIADAIAGVLGTKSVLVSNAKSEDLTGTDLLIVGSPINAWRPTQKVKSFLSGLKSGQLNKIKGAAFDTRVKSIISGNAAKKISKSLEQLGATIIMPPQAFYVKGNEGPLLEGEIEKAKDWAKKIQSLV